MINLKSYTDRLKSRSMVQQQFTLSSSFHLHDDDDSYSVATSLTGREGLWGLYD